MKQVYPEVVSGRYRAHFLQTDYLLMVLGHHWVINENILMQVLLLGGLMIHDLFQRFSDFEVKVSAVCKVQSLLL